MLFVVSPRGAHSGVAEAEIVTRRCWMTGGNKLPEAFILSVVPFVYLDSEKL